MQNKPKIKTLLVDDEERGRRNLATLLSRFCPEVEVVGQADGVGEAERLISLHQPDLVFLDIQMPTGNGFNLLKDGGSPFEVIFVTGYSQYAISALRKDAVDYLLKPVDVQELIAAVGKVRERLQQRVPQVVNLINQPQDQPEEKLFVHEGDRVVVLRAAEIASIEADDRYSHITTTQQQRHTLAKTLKEMEEFLTANIRFVRINRKFILNVDQIQDYSKGYPCIIELKDGRQFEVSRRKKQEVLAALKGERLPHDESDE